MAAIKSHSKQTVAHDRRPDRELAALLNARCEQITCWPDVKPSTPTVRSKFTLAVVAILTAISMNDRKMAPHGDNA